MLEALENPMNGRGARIPQLHGCGEGSEEGLSVLPPHTKVIVTGNNRTKSVLVGLQGVVKKAVGLGGWHWLVLKNGIEVKLQRNALSVIEEAPTSHDNDDTPTSHDDDDDLECNSLQWNDSNMGSYDARKSQQPRNHAHKTVGPSYQNLGSLSDDSQSKGSLSFPQISTKVDFSKLETKALRRYWKHFNLVDAVPNPSKEQLLDMVQSHFMSQVITGFVQAAKRLKAVCN